VSAREPNVVVKTRIKRRDRDRLRERATAQGRSIASHVAYLIRRDLEESHADHR
jgi:hypothetical protein